MAPNTRTSDTPATYPIQYARLTELDDGSYRLILATDRNIDMYEAAYRTTTLDYDVAIAELQIDADMTGSGALAPGVMLDWDEASNTVTIENYAVQPVKLNNVRVNLEDE